MAEEKKKHHPMHTPDGKFAKGNPGGKGAAILTKDKVRYGDILRKCVSDEDFKKVSAKLLERAVAGEPWAIRELMDRLMGKPKQFAEVDLSATYVDPKTIVNNVAILLGITEDGDEFIGIDKKEAAQIENKESK